MQKLKREKKKEKKEAVFPRFRRATNPVAAAAADAAEEGSSPFQGRITPAPRNGLVTQNEPKPLPVLRRLSPPAQRLRPHTQTRHRGKRACLSRPRAPDIRPLRLHHHDRSESDEDGTENQGNVNAHFDTASVMREQLTSTEATETPLNSTTSK